MSVSETAGRTRCVSTDPYHSMPNTFWLNAPPMGSHPSCSPNRYSSRMPTLGTNRDWPVTPTTCTTLSTIPPLWAAAATPSGMPTTTVRSRAVAVSSRVHGMRSASTCRTGMDWVNDVPRFPWTSWPRYSTYWVGRGWSRPYWTSRAARWSSVMFVLATARAGSPGRSRRRRNVTVTANQTVSRPRPRRRRTNRAMDMAGGPSLSRRSCGRWPRTPRARWRAARWA
jgi:hypothetical protein